MAFVTFAFFFKYAQIPPFRQCYSPYFLNTFPLSDSDETFSTWHGFFFSRHSPIPSIFLSLQLSDLALVTFTFFFSKILPHETLPLFLNAFPLSAYVLDDFKTEILFFKDNFLYEKILEKFLKNFFGNEIFFLSELKKIEHMFQTILR